MAKAEQKRKKPRGGRPRSWQHQPTKSLRVPVEFHSLLLKVAKTLDEGSTEAIVIQPEKRTAHRQAKKGQASLSALHIYRHSGHKVIRIQELIDALMKIMAED